jgi:uncharacterized protein
MRGRPWTVAAGGVALTVRLTPKGGRDAIDGVERSADGRVVLRARVRAAPSGGEANAALLRLIAGALGVAPKAVTLVAGQAARVKRLKIDGPAIALAAALERIAGSAETAGKP